MSRRRVKLVVSIVAASLAGFAAWSIGVRIAAGAIVYAPNAGRPMPAPLDGERRVEVGPPVASLAFEIVDADAPKGTVVVLHGIRDKRTSMRGWGKLFSANGFRTVLVDLRGHGRSTGEYLTYGAVDSQDLKTMMDALEAKGDRVGRLGVFGVSYGAAIAIQWAGIDPRIEAVVAVAPFWSLAAVVPNYSVIPVPVVFARSAIEQAGQWGGFNPSAADVGRAIVGTRAQILLMHGTADPKISPSHSERLHQVAPDHSELVLMQGEDHDSMVGDRSGTVKDRAPGWFARWLPAREGKE